MLMQVGAYEVLLDDTRAAAKKARAEASRCAARSMTGCSMYFRWDSTDSGEPRGMEEVAEYLRIIYRIHREPEGTVVKKVKTRTQRDGRPGAAESVGIFKTGA